MAYSKYFDVMTPATEAEPIHSMSNMDTYLSIGIKAGPIICCVLVLFIVLWVFHHKSQRMHCREKIP